MATMTTTSTQTHPPSAPQPTVPLDPTVTDLHGITLPARYEIRRLTSETDIIWASAIVIHSNMYCSPVWPRIYPEARAVRSKNMIPACDYLMRHQVNSGMSFGIFDKEYQFKRPESAATNGALYWDDVDVEEPEDSLLEKMDFPLVTVAMAYDGINAIDMAQMGPLMESLPLFGPSYGILHARDTRPESDWKATGPRQVLMRNATSTRKEYEGKGLMKKLAHFLIKEAESLGYRGINIETANDAVSHVWMNPPAPWKGEEISRLDMGTYEEENEKGEKVNPYHPATQVMLKVYASRDVSAQQDTAPQQGIAGLG